jgi:hypothetical protein
VKGLSQRQLSNARAGCGIRYGKGRLRGVGVVHGTNVPVRTDKRNGCDQETSSCRVFSRIFQPLEAMSVTCDRDTVVVNETPWERLHRLVELRRVRLDLTLAGIQAVGGPSPKYVQKLKNFTGPPSARQRASLMDLDRALQWEPGTSWGLVEHDRSGWSDAILEDEEQSLLELGPDECDHFGFVIAARLRAIPEGKERDDMMRAVLNLLGV